MISPLKTAREPEKLRGLMRCTMEGGKDIDARIRESISSPGVHSQFTPFLLALELSGHRQTDVNRCIHPPQPL